MSTYLHTEIASTANIELRTRVAVVDASGTSGLESLVLEDLDSGARETVPADALFAMIGSVPHTDYLGEQVQRDRWGFIFTGSDVSGDAAVRQDGRNPLMFETSLPGVFAIGDVRHGSVKRVASAVGAGAIVVAMVHEYLAMQQLGS
jgi:thioredoxin reductase (NADPH)